MAHDVFISYSTDDQKIVEGLSAYLEQNGIRCFIAYRDIVKGVDWAEAITSAIENCRLMIVIFSEHFNRSKQVDREIALAIEEAKPILTFKIQDAAFTGTKKYYLQNLNWIDAFPDAEKYFGNLCENVLLFLPEIRLKKEKQEKSEKKRQEQKMMEQTSVKVQEKQEEVKEKVKSNKYSVKSLYSILGVIIAIIIILISWFIIQNNRTKREPEIIKTPTIDTVQIKQQLPLSPTHNLSETKNTKKDPVATKTHKEIPEDSIESQKITFSASTTLISISGDTFKAQPGDIFDGKMKDGKVEQGKIIRNGETVKMFFNKRNF